MNKLAHTLQSRLLRRMRVRSVVSGTAARPRLSVRITNLHVTAQLVDDAASNTIAYASTVGAKVTSGTLTDKAAWVGTEIAKKAKGKNVVTVVFDRGAKRYHGRVKALAEAARNAGLEF